MSKLITSCSKTQKWIEESLLKSAQIDDFDLLDSEMETESKQKFDKFKSELPEPPVVNDITPLINPNEFGKSLLKKLYGKRPIAINQAAKRRIQKGLAEVTKGLHADGVPIDKIVKVLTNEYVFPIQEDGTKWSGFLLGSKECGTEESRNQQADIPLVATTKNGSFALTTSYLHISWCTLHNSNKFEVVCYIS